MQADCKGVFEKWKEFLVSSIVSEKLFEGEGILESLTSSLIFFCLVFH